MRRSIGTAIIPSPPPSSTRSHNRYNDNSLIDYQEPPTKDSLPPSATEPSVGESSRTRNVPRERWTPSWPANMTPPPQRSPPVPEQAFRELSMSPRQPLEQEGEDSLAPPARRGGPGEARPGQPAGRATPYRGAWRSDRTPTPPPVSLPPREYLQLSSLPPTQSPNDSVVQKLLVLDLNGALVYRHRSSGRNAQPRPYLCCFMEYLFLPEPGHNGDKNAWAVHVWSSAQPHNVRGMVEATFGMRWIEGVWEDETEEGKKGREIGEERLLGVWARDKMGLKREDYGRKVQTTKDLRKLIDHLDNPAFTERTVVLLDDSPLKAVFQPWSQIVIPEFDRRENNDSRVAAGVLEPGVGDQTPKGGIDRILLAVIGILDALRTVPNVPAWVRAGGLTFSINAPSSSSSSSSTSPTSPTSPLEDPAIESLPSHTSFTHWYTQPAIYARWIALGEAALQRKGIELRHGLEDPERREEITRNSKSQPQPEAGSSSVPAQGWTRKDRVYSPSRP